MRLLVASSAGVFALNYKKGIAIHLEEYFHGKPNGIPADHSTIDAVETVSPHSQILFLFFFFQLIFFSCI